MSNPDRVEKMIELRAPRSRVWRAISNGKDFGAWFGLGSDLELLGDFVPGAQITGKWTVDGRAVNEHFCTIVKVEPEQCLALDWIPYELSPGEDIAKHPRTHVEFRLEEVAGGTRLTISESGFSTLPADKQYKRAENGEGWALQAHALAAHVLGKIPVKVVATIRRPIAQVMEAIVDPAHMTNYFISKSSGRMTSGARLVWEWSDVGATAEINVRQVEDHRITFLWAGGGGDPTQVVLALTADGESTKLTATEGPFELSEAEAARAIGQTQGWTDFACSLRAYLEHGIDLRHGRRVA